MRIRLRYLLPVMVGPISIFLFYNIYPLKQNEILFTTTVVGLVVSFAAFVIAMLTYTSIDSVNVITQMEGNVLENDSYVTSFTSLLREFNMEDPDRAADEIFQKLEQRFSKNSRTAIDFASHLQYFIDLIVFFPYLFRSSDETEARMDKLLLIIDQRKRALLSISSGNLILIDETVKLIGSIISYQKLSKSKGQLGSSILDVRGTMLKNSVTQTVYYNYLGLYYNTKANSILRRKFELGHINFFSIKGLQEVKYKVNWMSDEEIELFTLYLLEAKNAFQKAMNFGKSDVMWEGFIKYNEARSTYLLKLVHSQYEGKNWDEIMNEALIARNRITILSKDIFEEEERPHLQEAFHFEKLLAGLVKINILLVENKNVTDAFNRIKYSYPTYDGILDDPIMKEPYNGKDPIIHKFRNDIIEFINK
jgi:hypothetical protein